MQVQVVFLIGICAFARIASVASSPLETIIEEWEVWTIVYARFTKKIHIKSLQSMTNKSLNLFRATASYKCTITRLEAPSQVPLPSIQSIHIWACCLYVNLYFNLKRWRIFGVVSHSGGRTPKTIRIDDLRRCVWHSISHEHYIL